MKEAFQRWLFVTRTRYLVARKNLVVEQAFVSGRQIPAFSPSPALAMLVLLAIGGAGTAAWLAGRDGVPAPAVATVSMPAISNSGYAPDRNKQAIPPSRETYAVAVDKAAHQLLVLKEEGDFYRIIKKFDISLGRVVGAKEREGDLRTPVGFYRIVEIKDGGTLPSIYGPKVFVTDYPNTYDIAKGRTGGGIWVHGSGLGTRTADTRGCVELDDRNVQQLEKWVGVNTPVAIFPDTFRLPVSDGRVEKRYLTMEFFYGDVINARAG